jgi:hypothetical protein
VLKRTHLVRLMMLYHYHHKYHHCLHLVFSQAVTELLKIFIYSPDLNSLLLNSYCRLFLIPY